MSRIVDGGGSGCSGGFGCGFVRQRNRRCPEGGPN